MQYHWTKRQRADKSQKPSRCISGFQVTWSSVSWISGSVASLVFRVARFRFLRWLVTDSVPDWVSPTALNSRDWDESLPPVAVPVVIEVDERARPFVGFVSESTEPRGSIGCADASAAGTPCWSSMYWSAAVSPMSSSSYSSSSSSSSSATGSRPDSSGTLIT